jgi:phosphate transport system substrate-binding protein
MAFAVYADIISIVLLETTPAAETPACPPPEQLLRTARIAMQLQYWTTNLSNLRNTGFFRTPLMRMASAIALLGAILGALVAPIAPAADLQSIKVDGSSTVYPLSNAVAEEFRKKELSPARVMVGISGTGGGFKKFCRGEIDISDASRPILAREMEICRAAGIDYLELPVAFDAITVVVNPRNTFLQSITVAELRKMWEPAAQGKVVTWRQINPAWPDSRFKLYGPGGDSGTFDYFTEAIMGKVQSARTDYAASEDDNVLVQGVSHDANALGYFGYSYYIENAQKLKAVPIVEKSGLTAVAPSPETVSNGSYRPLSRPIFIYVNAKSLGRPEVRLFVDYYLQHAMRLSKEVRTLPLPKSAYAQASGNLKKMKLGTVFGGVAETGVTIEELFRREARN